MPTKTPPVLSDFPRRVQDIILAEVLAAPFGTRVDDVLGFGHGATLVRVRWRIWYRQRHELTDGKGHAYSWPHIGRAWRRDHTTVMNGVASHLLENNDPAVALPDDWVERKHMAYRTSREKHAARYRHAYPHLGLPHVRTPT